MGNSVAIYAVIHIIYSKLILTELSIRASFTECANLRKRRSVWFKYLHQLRR